MSAFSLDAFEISDSVVRSLSRQREHRALRIRAAGDPSFARHFNRTIENRAAAGCHAPYCRVDISDVEVIEPEGGRFDDGLGEHAADCLPSGGEQLIGARKTGIGLRFLPTEELAVE